MSFFELDGALNDCEKPNISELLLLFIFEIFIFRSTICIKDFNSMNKQISAILSTILLAFVASSMADSSPEASAQDTKKMVQNNFVETAQKGIKLSGYVDAGYSYNFTGSGSYSQVNSRFGGDDAQRGDFNLYAVKIAL
ncbi:MAG: hypothetical protein EBT07_18510, partial [Actinobacteria bacterium]|nr:hypothetical protein [Actinomycetota bacterium]